MKNSWYLIRNSGIVLKGKDRRKKMSAPCAICFCFVILTNDPAMFFFVTLYYSTPRRWTAEKKYHHEVLNNYFWLILGLLNFLRNCDFRVCAQSKLGDSELFFLCHGSLIRLCSVTLLVEIQDQCCWHVISKAIWRNLEILCNILFWFFSTYKIETAKRAETAVWRNLEILRNICLFSSSCLCPLCCLTFVRWKKSK